MRGSVQRRRAGLSFAVWVLLINFMGGLVVFEALAEIVVVPPNFTVMTCVSDIATPHRLAINPDDGSLLIDDLDATSATRLP